MLTVALRAARRGRGREGLRRLRTPPDRGVPCPLQTGRTVADGHNLYVIFQPHLFSRTREFAKEFAESLSMADRAYVLDIYPAREHPIEGVTSELITGAGFSEVRYATAESAIEDIASYAPVATL